MNLVEPVVEEFQKRILRRVVVAVEEALVLRLEFILCLSLGFVDDRLWGAYGYAHTYPFDFVFLRDGVFVADHQIQHTALFLNAARDIFVEFLCHISLPPFDFWQHKQYHKKCSKSRPVGSKLHFQHNFLCCVFFLRGRILPRSFSKFGILVRPFERRASAHESTGRRVLC